MTRTTSFLHVFIKMLKLYIGGSNKMYFEKSLTLLRGIISRKKIEADLRNHLLKQVFTAQLEMWYRALFYIYLWGLGVCSLCVFSLDHSLNPYCLVVRTTTSSAYKHCKSSDNFLPNSLNRHLKWISCYPLHKCSIYWLFFVLCNLNPKSHQPAHQAKKR